jgi:hypothetical protein
MALYRTHFVVTRIAWTVSLLGSAVWIGSANRAAGENHSPVTASPPPQATAPSNFWAYRPLSSQQSPAVRNEAWVRTPIDRFVLAKLEAAGLQPSPPADPQVLCRRLYFDLTGLPPTPADVDDFVSQYTASTPRQNRPTGEKAYEALVDKLLASPQYGERWGRHWLDLARYADSAGFHEDLDRPYAWRYRDYVIRSFNEDKPYARFIEEQLSGDELAPDDAQAWIATGFCRNGPTNDLNMGQGAAKERYRMDLLDDVLSTTSTVFLGQTIGCARCHDHKYDPIAQTDYYRMLAVFDNTKRIDVGKDAGGKIVEVIPAGDKKQKKESDKPTTKPSIMALTDAGPIPRTTCLLRRGDVTKPGPAVEPGVPQAMAYEPLVCPTVTAEAKTTGRRLALAKWIASPRNPLTWRVVVNRIWQHHFGVGLVATPSNFGKSGAAPTHPELIDWLADEMLANGGRWKPIHRLIVTSAAYRQSASSNEAALSVDPQNRLLWRMNQRRLEAEALRDAILCVAGTLNLTAGGPGIKPRIRPELLVASQRNKWPIVQHEGPDLWRRSVYIYVKRQLPFPMLELFDAPSTTQTCDRRNENVVPTQALVLMNDEFTEEQAGRFADRVIREAGAKPDDEVACAVRLALIRLPSSVEIAEATQFLAQQTAAHREGGHDPSQAARLALLDFCHVLFNCNEFAYLN